MLIQEVWSVIEKSFRVLLKTVFLNYVGYILNLFSAEILEKDICGNPSLIICEDEPCCALVNDKYFKVIKSKDKMLVKCTKM